MGIENSVEHIHTRYDNSLPGEYNVTSYFWVTLGDRNCFEWKGKVVPKPLVSVVGRDGVSEAEKVYEDFCSARSEKRTYGSFRNSWKGVPIRNAGR